MFLSSYDKATGEERGAVYMPGAQTASAMTFMLNGNSTLCLAPAASRCRGD